VVAGALRGRRIESPPGDAARPTSDRVREATFNALESLGAIEGARVLDLFAGTGALGIEALSRGAAHVTFVEQDRRVLAVLRRNIDALDLADRADVVVGDAARFLPPSAPDRTSGVVFDLALLDPPYAYDGWDDLLRRLPAARAVIESDRPVDLPAGWGMRREKRYGGTLVAVIERTRAEPDV